jgi:hypothetical protein
MSLQPRAGVEADAAGVSETIMLSAPTATISSAYYGNTTSLKQVTVAPGGKSLTFTVLKGQNILTVNLISPTAASETAVLYQGSTIITAVMVSNQVGIAAIPVLGN